jgi:hypothetical protein
MGGGMIFDERAWRAAVGIILDAKEDPEELAWALGPGRVRLPAGHTAIVLLDKWQAFLRGQRGHLTEAELAPLVVRQVDFLKSRVIELETAARAELAVSEAVSEGSRDLKAIVRALRHRAERIRAEQEDDLSMAFLLEALADDIARDAGLA